MMRKLSFLLIFLSGFSYYGNAQRCGTDDLNWKLSQSSATYRQNIQDNNALIAQIVRNSSNSKI
ncbi:MAG: hypothetical protein ABI378_11710, partial [Chitinophagaceae bacterium]